MDSERLLQLLEEVREKKISTSQAVAQLRHMPYEELGFAKIDHDPFKSFAGSDEIRMSLAAKIIEAHGGLVQHDQNRFFATLPLSE